METAYGWSVFGQSKEGELTLFESFATEEAAREFVLELGQYWPHLAAKDFAA